MHLWWKTAGPDGAEKVIQDVRCQALEVSEELGWLPVAHFIM